MNARFLGLVLLAAALPASAKDAADYFHGAAFKHVEGKRQEALLEAEEGLRRFPGDAKLNSLAEHLRKLDDDKNNPSGGDGDKNKKDDKKDPNKDKGNDDEKDKDPGKNEQDGKQPPSEDEGKDGKDGKNPPGARPGEMSEEEAERLLNSFADDEKKEQRELQKLMRKRLETEQDW